MEFLVNPDANARQKFCFIWFHKAFQKIKLLIRTLIVDPSQHLGQKLSLNIAETIY